MHATINRSGTVNLRAVLSGAHNRRFHFLALVVGGAIVTGCAGGLTTPTAPSAMTAPATRTSASMEAPGTTAFMPEAAPLSFIMNETGGSGYSGTCTIGDARTGFRFKMEGQGVPDALIYFILQDVATGTRYQRVVAADQRGAFRTRWDDIIFFSSGASVACSLMGLDGTLLAAGATFTLP